MPLPRAPIFIAHPFRRAVRIRGADFVTFMADQLTFLPDAAHPAGLRYQPEFTSTDEEQALIARIRALPLAPFQFGAFEGKRRVLSFGWHYDYTQQRLVEAEAVPVFIRPTIAQVEQWASLPDNAIRQVLFTEYDTGTGIGWHRDKRHFDLVFGLSLGSPCKLRFRRKHGSKWQRHTLDAAPRSLYLMSGASRTDWEHSIPPVQTARYSITFRTLVA
jgi:alkylated DNA repair dioxygenase AlkB